MQKIFLRILSVLSVLLLVLTLNSSRAVAADGDSLFAGIQVHTINIRFTEPNYWDSLIFYYNQGLEHYMSATVIANGITINNVGVRLKGNSSFTHPNNKKSFRLSFNEFVSSQRWNGLRGVHLNNFWNDPSFIREKLHLDYCQREGIVAPRCNYVRLSINDTLFAFYSLIEHVNNAFMTSRYGTNAGEQFKAVDAIGTSNDIFSDFVWMGNDSTEYFDHYELKSDENENTWRRLITLIDTINHSETLSSSLPTKVNMLPYYKATAMDNLFCNMDSYAYTGRNFYIFLPEPSYKMEWLVWDVGLSMGGLPGGPSTVENLPITYVVNDTSRPLLSRILGNTALKNEYLMAYCELFSEFTTSKLFPKIDSIANVIRPYVYEDPRKMFTNAQFETNIVSDITVAGSRKPGLKSYISQRRSFVASQLNALGISCETGISNQSSVVKTFELMQNYPNPFNPETQISYSLFETENVTLKIYDNLGKEVLTLISGTDQAPGSYSVMWNGKNAAGVTMPSGVYYYKLQTAGYSVTKKMMLLK